MLSESGRYRISRCPDAFNAFNGLVQPEGLAALAEILESRGRILPDPTNDARDPWSPWREMGLHFMTVYLTSAWGISEGEMITFLEQWGIPISELERHKEEILFEVLYQNYKLK